MSSYPPSPSMPPQFARPKTWYQRNWKWIVSVAIVSMSLIFIGFFAAIFFGVFAMMKSSGAYQGAVQRALASPAVQARLGTPITVGRFTSGSINESGSSGTARLSIPLHGPRGDASISVIAKETANRWTFDTLEVDVDGDDKPIPLLDDVPAPSPHAIPSDSSGTPSGTT